MIGLIRFKVIRASRILLVFSIVVLIAAAGLFLFGMSNQNATPASADLVHEESARTQTVFAPFSLRSDDPRHFDPASEPQGMTVEILEGTERPTEYVPKVLIYHTHTHEAYAQDPGDPYESVEAWRTTDADHSVLRLGKELAARLRSYGFYVVHNTKDHEMDALSTAYERSLLTLESYEEPFDLYIDLHRDAFSKGLPLRYTSESGQAMAQLMFLIGNGNGFIEKPFYKENLAFAEKLTERINAAFPGLCRDVLVKDGRYNQHIGMFSILIEVGHNMNTLSEALSSLDPLSDGIFDLMIKSPDAGLTALQKGN